jgi:hypothetical protein
LRRAYSGIEVFFKTKHAFDPENRFTSRFFEQHGKGGPRVNDPLRVTIAAAAN